jgi:hypothetical protein
MFALSDIGVLMTRIGLAGFSAMGLCGFFRLSEVPQV